MPGEHFPVLWIGQTAVVALPAEIDITIADQVREDLLSVVNQGAALLVADLTNTTFCDSSGVSALVRASRRAQASGGKMRLVVRAPAVHRVLALTGVDRLIAWPNQNIAPRIAKGVLGRVHEATDVIVCRQRPLIARLTSITDAVRP